MCLPQRMLIIQKVQVKEKEKLQMKENINKSSGLKMNRSYTLGRCNITLTK